MSLTSHSAAGLKLGAEDPGTERLSSFRGPCANVLGVAVDALNLEVALSRVKRILRSGKKGYVCAIDVNGVLSARRNPDVARTFAEAAIAIPDGTPTVWVGRLQKHVSMEAVTGPELMYEMFSRKEFADYRHFFYGGKDGVAGELAANMLRRFPWTRIAGSFTPPFRELTAAEESDLAQTIRACKPDIIWVGIGAPRQDLFMRRMLPRLETRLMLGVGAAFDFHTGRVRDCAPWVKKMGFHWLHRLLQDPKRLWRRNVSNAAFLWHIALQLTGLKVYRLPTSLADCENVGLFPTNSPTVARESNQSSSISNRALRAAHTVGQICSDDQAAHAKGRARQA